MNLSDLSTILLAGLAILLSLFAALASARATGKTAERLKNENASLKTEAKIKETSDALADEADAVRTGDTSSDELRVDPIPDKWLRD
ncbi:MAG TPA: hypothetical protein PKE16_10115 [Hyphomicrobium sp.]|nr:hypothetical protein [Hyphomicrobium sp.]